jgi:hypothetical protein
LSTTGNEEVVYFGGANTVSAGGLSITNYFETGTATSANRRVDLQSKDKDGNLRDMVLQPSGGNLGLGVTPSAWISSYRALNIGDSGLVTSRTGASINNIEIGVNWFRDSGAAFRYKANGYGTNYQQYDGAHYWYTAGSGTAGNTISFTQALTLNANGALVLQGGNTSASGVGVAFPATQSASSDANTLDDYEEGTWTATLTDGTNTTTSDGATYRKIGSLVFISFQFYNKNISAWNAANLSVTGLPFTVATNHDSFVTANTPNGFTVSGPLAMGFSNSSTSSGLYYRGGSSNWAGVQKGDITNNSNFSLYLSACYTAS